MAARNAIAAEKAAEEAVAAAASVNEFVGATAELSKSFGKTLGQSTAAAEALSKGATAVGIGFTFNDAVAAVRTGNRQKAFDAFYGGASLGAS